MVTEKQKRMRYHTSKSKEVFPMRLKNKVAIITGGSRGIGFATADRFLKDGAVVIITASTQESADKAVAQLKEKYPDSTAAGISPDLASL